MQWTPKFQYATRTDTGMKRQNNEDSYCITLCPEDTLWFNRGHLFAVADGMGGHEVGELASKTAIDTLPHVFYKSGREHPNEALLEALTEANRAIYDIGTKNRDFKRMGTTCSSLVMYADGFIVGHAGDSRIYRVREERVDQLTFDHTVAWEQKLRKHHDQSLVDVDPEKYGHVLTRCLGPEAHVKIDVEGPFEYQPGDVFIVCSDGLTKYVSDVEIGTYGKFLPPSDAARLLVNLANLRGGADNCTVIVVRVSKQDGSTTLPATVEYVVPPMNTRRIQLALFLGTLAAGIGAGVLSYYQWAVPAAILGILAVIFLISSYVTSRQRQRFASGEFEMPEDGSSTIFFRPYRTAAIRLNAASAEKLGEAAARLSNTAEAADWNCDWNAFHAKQEQAVSATHERKYRQAILEWSRAIDLLFGGMPK